MPLDFMRGVLGVIAIGCVYMAARTLVSWRRGEIKIRRLYGWVIRATLCLLAVAWRHPVDTVDIVIWSLAAVAFAGAYWDASRPRKQEDLTHQIFPE